MTDQPMSGPCRDGRIMHLWHTTPTGILCSECGATWQQSVTIDPVNHPSHYTQGSVECIDAIESALGPEGFVAFLRGQVIEYQWRVGLKDNAAQDAAKANWYGERLVRALEKRS